MSPPNRLGLRLQGVGCRQTPATVSGVPGDLVLMVTGGMLRNVMLLLPLERPVESDEPYQPLNVAHPANVTISRRAQLGSAGFNVPAIKRPSRSEPPRP